MKTKKISTYIFEHKFAYLFAILSMIISVSLDLMSPQLTKRIIDEVIIGKETWKLKYLLAGILTIGIGRCIFQYVKEYTFDVTGFKIAAEMRHHLFDHIQSLSADFFDRTNTGELMARIKDDIDRIGDGLTFVGMLMIEVVIHTSIVLCYRHCHGTKAGLRIRSDQRRDRYPEYRSGRKPCRSTYGESLCQREI